MKILFVTEFYPQKGSKNFTGGVEARTFFTAEALKKSNQVQIIHKPRTNISANIFSIFDRIIFQFSAFFKTIFSEADVIEASNFTTYLPAFFAARIKNKPVVAWYPDVYQGTWFKYYDPITAFLGFWQEAISLKLGWDKIIALSHTTKEKLVGAGIDPSKIVVIYGGVDTQSLKSLKQKKLSTPTICTAARLVNYKRVDDLIKAVSLINQNGTNLNAIIMGDGPERKYMEDLTEKLDLKDKVKFLGNVPNTTVLKTISSCQLFSLPSIVEGLGIVTIESLAAGTPFVSSDIPPTREITKGGKGGLLFAPKDYHDLAKKITKLLGDKELYKKKQAEAFELVKNYDWSIIAKQTEDAFTKILKN